MPSHYLNQWWLDHWRIYGSLGLDELNIVVSHFKSWYKESWQYQISFWYFTTYHYMCKCFPTAPLLYKKCLWRISSLDCFIESVRNRIRELQNWIIWYFVLVLLGISHWRGCIYADAMGDISQRHKEIIVRIKSDFIWSPIILFKFAHL